MRSFSPPLSALRRHTLWWSIVFAITAACGPQSPADPQPDPDEEQPVFFGNCRSDQQCPGQQRCELELCVVPVAESTLRYGLTILPTGASMIAPQRIGARAWPVQDARVEVEELVQVEVRIQGASSTLNATLVAIPIDELPEAQAQAPLREGRATLRAARGEYALALIPDSGALPRFDLGTVTLERDEELVLEVPATSELRELRGTLVRRSGLPLDLLDLPVRDARVIGIDPDSRQTTSSALTNALGEFTLSAPDDGRVYDLHVSPAQPGDLIPTLVFEDALGSSASASRFHLGDWLVDLLTLQVQLRAEASAEPVDWSEVEVRASAPLGLGLLQLPLEVDARGRAEARLLAGTYDISVRPTPESTLEGASATVSLLDALRLTTIDLPLRPRVTGVVLDSRGDAVASARVRLDHVQNPTFSRTLSTNEEGRWSANLPRGELRATLTPPASSGQPRQIEVFTVGDETPTLLWRLAAPTLVRGRLTHPEHTTAAITLQLTHPLTGEVIAEGRTDASGRYQIIIPATALDGLR